MNDFDKLLDELVETTSSCYGCVGKTEEWSGVDVNEVKNELEKVKEKANMNGSKVYVIEDKSEHEIPNEVVLKYIGSWIHDNFIDLDSRDGNKVDTGYPLKYFAEIVRYMANEIDIWKLNDVKFDKFCRELMEIRIPFRMDIMNRLYNGSNEYGTRWKNRCLIVNGTECIISTDCMRLRLSELKSNDKKERIEIIRRTGLTQPIHILKDFMNYVKNPKKFVKNKNFESCVIHKVLNEIGINVSADLVKQYLLKYTSSLLCYETKVLENTDYDDNLRGWIGENKLKLLYRASEHEYTAKSFHECCDDEGPTLILIKSTDGWIFGGYTSQSWSGYGICYDLIVINRL